MEILKKKNGHKCSLLCGCDGSWGSFFVKIFLALVIVVFVLCLSMFVFSRMTGKSVGANIFGIREMMGNKTVQQAGFGVKGGEWGMKETRMNAVRLFGTVEKIEGNKITIKDNAAMEQVVLSQAGTVILSADGEVSLSAVKVGVSIVSLGTYNKDNQLVAKAINILK